MDIGRSFTYMFDDQDWLKKIAIGGVLNIIPVVSFIPMGYGLRTLNNVAAGTETPLPEWDDWGGDFTKGLMVTLAALIASIPIWAVQVLSIIVAAVAGETSDIAGLCVAGVSCLAVLWGIAMLVYLPAAVIRYATKGEFSAFFQFGEVFAFIRDNLSDYIVAILLILAAGVVASVVGSIACIIGAFFTAFWATLVSSHLMGQLQAEAATAAGPGGFATTDLSSEEGDS